MTSVQIRGMHASESPRFAEFCKGYKGTISDFIESLSNNEEKLAFWYFELEAKKLNDSNEHINVYKPKSFHELVANLLQHPDELTPDMLYQLIYLIKINEKEKLIFLTRLKEFFTDREKDLTAREISSVLHGFWHLNYTDLNKNRLEVPGINASEFEDFYSRYSPKFDLRHHIIFALLYAYQSGYKSSLVRSILNSIHSNYDKIDYDNASIIVLTFLKVISDDFENSLQEYDSIEQHPLFPTFKKFDQKYNFQELPCSYIHYRSLLFRLSFKSTMNESLPNISKFIWRCFKYHSKKGYISAQDRVFFCFYLCEQPIDLDQTEIDNLIGDVVQSYRSEINESMLIFPIRILSRFAFKGL